MSGSCSCSTQRTNGDGLKRLTLHPKRQPALDPNLAVAYLARGRLLWTPANHFPHEKAVREYRRALALDPNLDEARNQLALVYYHVGTLDEAIQESQRAISTNPANNLAQLRIGQVLNSQGKYAEALTVLSALPPQVNPALIGHQSAWALVNLGRVEEASAMVEQLINKSPEDTGGVLTSIQAVLAASKGDERLAEERVKLAIRERKRFRTFSSYGIPHRVHVRPYEPERRGDQMARSRGD